MTETVTREDIAGIYDQLSKRALRRAGEQTFVGDYHGHIQVAVAHEQRARLVRQTDKLGRPMGSRT